MIVICQATDAKFIVHEHKCGCGQVAVGVIALVQFTVFFPIS